VSQQFHFYTKRAIAVAVLLAALLWTADWLLLWNRPAEDGARFGEVEVHYRFAVHLKNKQIEQLSEKPKLEQCVHSVFPHFNETPCWYLLRHTEQLQELDGGQWRFFRGE